MSEPAQTPANTTYRLRFTNDWDDRWTEDRNSVHWFVALGEPWPQSKHPHRRMIRETTRNLELAKEFASLDECRETLVIAGQPHGWSVIDMDGRVVE